MKTIYDEIDENHNKLGLSRIIPRTNIIVMIMPNGDTSFFDNQCKQISLDELETVLDLVHRFQDFCQRG